MVRKEMGFDAALSPGENAGHTLPRMVREYFAAGREVAAKPADSEALHQFRLKGKRLRYAMELYGPCYGKLFEKYLEALRKAQTILGNLNDCAAAERLLKSAGVDEGAVPFLRERAEKLHQEFLQFWAQEMDVEAFERRWFHYMESPRKPRVPAPQE